MIKWTNEDDLLLINIIEGEKDIKSGIDRAAEEFNTTFFSIRNRWYSNTIKKMREKRAISRSINASNIDKEVPVDIQTALYLLNEAVEEQLKSLYMQIEELKDKNIKIIEEREILQAKYDEISEERSMFYRIIEKARDIVAKEVLGEIKPKTFKMEENGNLEAI